MNSTPNLEHIILSCKKGNRNGQRKLYQLFYSFGMSISLRYTNNRNEAEEILNDGFFKVFSKIGSFDLSYPFRPWFRTIIVHAAIDYFRSQRRFKETFSSWEEDYDLEVENLVLNHLAYQDILKAVQQLTPAYRMVFNLYAIEGYKHHEIAEKLNISTGTSKSNLAKARKQLKAILLSMGIMMTGS